MPIRSTRCRDLKPKDVKAMKTARIWFATKSAAYMSPVPLDVKCNDALEWFIELYPDFQGQLCLMKNTKYTESNGDPQKRHYTYEVDQGKYRKYRYSNPTEWKIVIA